MRALVWFLVPWTAVCVVVFLVASSFFTAWDGVAVSIRRAPGTRNEAPPEVWQVLIVGEDGPTEVGWTHAVVDGLDLPVDSLALPPNEIPPERPATRKGRFQLHYLVDRPGQGFVTVPTTSPRTLGVALVLFGLGFAVRNMIWAGSPIAIRRQDLLLPEALAAPGAPAEGRGTGRQRPSIPKKQPPPSRPTRGPRR